MTKTKRILVKSAAGNYCVMCGSDMVGRLSAWIARTGKCSSVHVVTSAKVWTAVGKKVLLGLSGTKVHVHKFDDSETRKNLRSVETIARSLVKAGADRHSVIIAVG